MPSQPPSNKRPLALTAPVATRRSSRGSTVPPPQDEQDEEVENGPSPAKKSRNNKGKDKAHHRSAGLGAPSIIPTVFPAFGGLDDDGPPTLSPLADQTNLPSASTSRLDSDSSRQGLPSSSSSLPSTHTKHSSAPFSSSSRGLTSDDVAADSDRATRKADKKARKKADKHRMAALAAELQDFQQREALRLAAEEHHSAHLAAQTVQRTVHTPAPKAVRAARRTGNAVDDLIKQAGKQTAYMKACWITGQQRRVLFHGECGPGAEDDWVPDGPPADFCDTLEWTLELKTYVDRLLSTVPDEYTPDEIQKLFSLGMTMARAEIRTRVDQALPKLFKLIPLADLDNRESDAVIALQGDTGMDFAFANPTARRSSERAFLSAECLVEMGSALVWGLESIGCDSPIERSHGKPSKTKAIQWSLREATPSFIALCVLCIRWKLSGVANFQAESQSLKFAQLYRQIRNSVTVNDATPAPQRSRILKVLRQWTTSLFDRSDGDDDPEDHFRRPDVDFAGDFGNEFGTDDEEEEVVDEEEDAGDNAASVAGRSGDGGR
ncbi:hypothetical protein P7C70_g6805, partial [Phenoliferia sp. Uapishka_3]